MSYTPHIYLCLTEADEPDNLAMVQDADVVLLVRRSGHVEVFKCRDPMVFDVSMPERDWSYSMVPV